MKKPKYSIRQNPENGKWRILYRTFWTARYIRFPYSKETIEWPYKAGAVRTVRYDIKMTRRAEGKQHD